METLRLGFKSRAYTSDKSQSLSGLLGFPTDGMGRWSWLLGRLTREQPHVGPGGLPPRREDAAAGAALPPPPFGASVLRGRPVGWRMARSRPRRICCQDSADPLSAASCPGPWHPLLCGLTMTPEAFLGQRTEAGCEVLRPVGDSVAWVRSPRQLLHVGLSTCIVGCSSLGRGKPLGAVLCDPHCLPGLQTPYGSMGEVGCFSPPPQ